MKHINSIRTQLLLAIAIILFIFLLAAMGGLYLLQKATLTEDAVKKVTEISGLIKTGLKYQMLKNNTELTQILLDEIKAYKNISETLIINAEGIVKFSSNTEHMMTKISKDNDECRQCHHDTTVRENVTLKTKNPQGASILRNVTHIYNEVPCFSCHPATQKILGLLFVDYSTADTDALIKSTLLRLLLTAAATFIIISLVISYFTTRWIHKPIALLVDGANEIIKGNYEKQIHYGGNAEFKILADSFNEMSNSIVQHISDINNKSFELSVLYAIVKKISETIYLEELKIIVIDLLLELLNCDKCIVITPTLETDVFEIIVKEKGAPPGKSTIKYPDTVTASILREEHLYEPFIQWISKELTIPELSSDSLSAYVPLIIRDFRLGLVITVRNADNPFDDEGFRLINLIKEHLAVAFENARLYSMAITDELTRLFTVRHFQTQMEIEMSRYMRYGQKYSILMMDIDKFKSVNDTYGHPAGDIVLKEVASIIRNSLRDIDVPCRYGGEEFAVILPETTEKGNLLVAERIRSNIEKKVIELGNGTNISVTISIGAASCPQNGIEARDIILAADKALYTAKQAGRNKVVLG